MWVKGIVMRLRASLALSVALLSAQAAGAHGVHVAAELTQAVHVRATYDTGQPMAQAQVALFAPSNPAQVWARGVTDDNGTFTFIPDPAEIGQWSVQVRQAGHGAIVSVSTGSTAPQGAQPAPQSMAQKLLMIALVAWGALGTALFFWRRKGAAHASA
jgi:nickel transport protein